MALLKGKQKRQQARLRNKRNRLEKISKSIWISCVAMKVTIKCLFLNQLRINQNTMDSAMRDLIQDMRIWMRNFSKKNTKENFWRINGAQEADHLVDQVIPQMRKFLTQIMKLDTTNCLTTQNKEAKLPKAVELHISMTMKVIDPVMNIWEEDTHEKKMKGKNDIGRNEVIGDMQKEQLRVIKGHKRIIV